MNKTFEPKTDKDLLDVQNVMHCLRHDCAHLDKPTVKNRVKQAVDIIQKKTKLDVDRITSIIQYIDKV